MTVYFWGVDDLRPGSSKHTVALTAETPPEVLAAAQDPANGFGKYILVRELGHGGMGVVYLAWQGDLRRWVALKFIRGIEGADELARFEREARTAAALVHPNIVPVYEVGALDGKHYYSMMFVRGRSFDAVLKAKPSLRDAVDWLCQALLAVDYANLQGVIHRDIKPANLLLGDDGRVYVMDFGLARFQKPGSSLTASGFAVGTPQYMSPEQASGRIHGIDGRCDVYSFGAALYEIITGRQPFDGTNIDILLSVISTDPVAPRRLNPSIPSDLETVCLRAMDKEPARRYASCRDLADDLRRWLDGDPILARPAGAVSKAIRRIRKHKLLTAALSLAAVAGFAALGFFAYAQLVARRAAEQQSSTLETRKELDQIRLRVQAAAQRIDRWDENLLKPAFDVTATWPQLRDAIKEIEELRGSRRDLPEADFAIGKALRRLGDPEGAIARFTAALEGAPDFGPALYERGRARLDKALARTAAMRDAPRDFIEEFQRSGVPAEVRADLQRARQLGNIGADQVVLADALLASVARDHDHAIELCSGAISKGSTDADFFVVRGQARVILAASIAKLDQARACLGLAIGDLLRAADIRRSDYDVHNDLAYAYYVEAWCLGDGGVDSRPSVLRGSLVAGRMRVIRPADTRAAWRELELQEHGIEYELNHSGDIGPFARRSTELLDELEKLGADPRDVKFQRATLECWIAQAEFRVGSNPRERIDRAIKLFEEVHGDHPNLVGSIANYAAMLSLRMRTRMESGDYAIEDDYRRGMALFDKLTRPLKILVELPARANLHEMYATSLEARGLDPSPAIDAGVADLRVCARHLPDTPVPWSNLGNALTKRAERKASRGGDPADDLAEALAALDHALRVKPDLANAYNLRGGVHRMLGELAANRGDDPSASMRAALADYGKAIDLSPDFIDARINRGVLYFEGAQQLMAAGEDPEPMLRLSQADNEAAVKAAPTSAVAWLNLGLDHSIRAAWLVRRKIDPGSELDLAEKAITKSLECNPNYLDARMELAGVFGTRGDARALAGDDPLPDIRRSIAEYTKVLEKAPEHIHALNNRATIWNDLGKRTTGDDARKAFDAAVVDLSAVLRLKPDHWRALANRSVSWKGLGEWARAADDLEAAVKINPAIEKRFRPEINRLRKLAGEQ